MYACIYSCTFWGSGAMSANRASILARLPSIFVWNSVILGLRFPSVKKYLL